MAPEITPEELVARVEAGEPLHILDIRAPEWLLSGRIDVVPEDRFHNIIGSSLQQAAASGTIPLETDEPLAVVCARGLSSGPVADLLEHLGFEALSVAGGMQRWMHTLIHRELPATASLDGLIQFDRMGKGSLGYLLISDGEALVIDPPRKIDAILETAASESAKIVGFADTHLHADYISGAPAGAGAMGVPYYLHPEDSFYPYDGTPGKISYESIEDGSVIEFGKTKVSVFHNPGHTLGSVSFLVDDEAAFTGDFVFIRSLGRPDLGGKVAEWTKLLWASLERMRAEWPESIICYPAHYSVDGERNPDKSIGKSLADITASNEPLQIREEDAFTEWVLARQSSFPEVYKKIKAINIALLEPTEEEADEYDVGKNECAVG